MPMPKSAIEDGSGIVGTTDEVTTAATELSTGVPTSPDTAIEIRPTGLEAAVSKLNEAVPPEIGAKSIVTVAPEPVAGLGVNPPMLLDS